jgi:thioredoxin reductase (NADPH)
MYSARALLIATGSRYKRLGTAGEDKYIGAGIHFCATCDGPFYKDLPVAVVGGGNSATEESLSLVKFVDKVTLLVRGNELTASQVIQEKVLNHPKIEVRFNTDILQFSGSGGKLKEVLLHNNQTGTQETIHPAGVFVFIGLTPNTRLLNGSGIQLTPWDFVQTGHDLVHDGQEIAAFAGREPAFLETSVPGIFAAGDVRQGSTKQVASAAGEGASAALLIREYLKRV